MEKIGMKFGLEINLQSRYKKRLRSNLDLYGGPWNKGCFLKSFKTRLIWTSVNSGLTRLVPRAGERSTAYHKELSSYLLSAGPWRPLTCGQVGLKWLSRTRRIPCQGSQGSPDLPPSLYLRKLTIFIYFSTFYLLLLLYFIQTNVN